MSWHPHCPAVTPLQLHRYNNCIHKQHSRPLNPSSRHCSVHLTIKRTVRLDPPCHPNQTSLSPPHSSPPPPSLPTAPTPNPPLPMALLLPPRSPPNSSSPLASPTTFGSFSPLGSTTSSLKPPSPPRLTSPPGSDARSCSNAKTYSPCSRSSCVGRTTKWLIYPRRSGGRG